VLVVLPPAEFPEVELPPPAELLLELELPELELPPPAPAPELPPAPALPVPLLPPELAPEPNPPVFPAGFVEVFTWVLETLKLASAAVLTFTLGAVVLTTVELDNPLESVLAWTVLLHHEHIRVLLCEYENPLQE
jgi:hypothetical protein